jgi:hypothetical protein
MKRAGHSNFKTTQTYIDLAGVTFRQEAERLEERIFGRIGTKNGHKPEIAEPEGATAASTSEAQETAA